MTFLKHVLRQQPLKYCLCSTWCFGIEDALEIGRWVEKQLIKRIDFYVGENTVVICNTSVADFYKAYFDDIKPFNGSPDGWKPWQPNEGEQHHAD